MRVVVTGGSGFIGSHVVDKLLDRGHNVVVVFDKEKPGKIASARAMRRVKWVHGDIRDYADCRRAIDKAHSIIHLAALINVDQSLKSPIPFYETNVLGTMNVLEAVRKSSPQPIKFVYMSTAEIYGHIPKGKADESYPCKPRSPYAASKYAAERYCLSYHAAYGAPEITVLRGFNTYGPKQSCGVKGAVVANFITRILDDHPPRIFGSGAQSRDYTFVGDMAEGIARAAVRTGMGGEVVNLASEQTWTIRRLADMILGYMNIDLKPVHVKERRGENMRSCGDAEKAWHLLKWRPKTDIGEGLRQTINWYRRRRE